MWEEIQNYYQKLIYHKKCFHWVCANESVASIVQLQRIITQENFLKQLWLFNVNGFENNKHKYTLELIQHSHVLNRIEIKEVINNV